MEKREGREGEEKEIETSNKVNGKVIPIGRYYELRDNDYLQFGNSPIDFVLKHR